MSTLIPNSFQHPNAYIDWIAYYLTPEEEKVLNKAIREIIGWQDKIADRKARIALSIFVDGKFSKKTGERLCMGCGLSLNTIRKALAALDKYGILLKDDEPTQEGQMYRLQDDFNAVDMAGLKVRREKRDAKNAARTKKATATTLAKNRLGVTSRDTLGVTSHDTQGVTSRDSKETQGNPIETQITPEPKQDDFSDLAWNDGSNSQMEIELPETTDPFLFAAEIEARGNGKRSWTVPAEAGGEDPYMHGPLSAACDVCEIPQDELSKDQQQSWADGLRDIAKEWRATPEEVTDAISRIRTDESGVSYKSYSSPRQYSFASDVGKLIATARCAESPEDGPPRAPAIYAMDTSPEWLT